MSADRPWIKPAAPGPSATPPWRAKPAATAEVGATPDGAAGGARAVSATETNGAGAPASFDADAVRLHIEMLHELAAGQDGVIPLCIFGENPDSGQKIAVVQQFRVGDVDGMASAAIAYENNPHANVYAPLAVMRRLPPNKKGGVEDVGAVLGAVIDDDADANLAANTPIDANYVLKTSSENRQKFILGHLE